MHPTSVNLRICTICLRVLVDGAWVAPETIILELRSFDYASLPHFHSALCTTCEEAIIERRAKPSERLAA
jgi:hypothetical protein